MFNEKELATGLGGVTVKDAYIGMQLLDKAASNGVIQPTEFTVLAEWRTALVEAIQRSVGKNYDQEVQKMNEERLKAQQAAQQAALESYQKSQQSDTDKTSDSEAE